MRKMKNSKGFTLMEMLIVVAIIAVLIAIAIPTFTASLNKARVATDEANIRSGYASVMAEVLTAEPTPAQNTVYILQKDGSVLKQGDTTTANPNPYKCFGKSDANGVEIAGQKVTKWEKDYTVKYTITSDATKADKITVKIDPVQPTPTGNGG